MAVVSGSCVWVKGCRDSRGYGGGGLKVMGEAVNRWTVYNVEGAFPHCNEL